MSTTRRLWLGLAALLIVGFDTLLWMGGGIHRQAPHMPEAVVTTDGTTVFTRADIERGRQLWQSIGSQRRGSIWGQGALIAPEGSADWLRCETMVWQELRARYDRLGEGDQAKLQAEFRSLIRNNTWDAATDRITISGRHAQAITRVAAHYESQFPNDPATLPLRETCAMRESTMPDLAFRRALVAFFWWTSWAEVTERPEAAVAVGVAGG